LKDDYDHLTKEKDHDKKSSAYDIGADEEYLPDYFVFDAP